MDPASAQHLGQGRARRIRTGLELAGLLVHALPVCGIGGRPGGDPPPAGEEVIQSGTWVIASSSASNAATLPAGNGDGGEGLLDVDGAGRVAGRP